MINARDALIVWSDDDKGRIRDVRVLGPGEDDQIDHSADNSRGRCDVDWMSGHPHETPIGIFVNMIADGFASRDSLKGAVTEFAKIRECGWAREMMVAFGMDAPSTPKPTPIR